MRSVLLVLFTKPSWRTIYLMFGNIGLLFNINIVSRKTHRRNSISLYILSMTVCNLICLNFGTLPFIYALDRDDLLTTSILMCKLQFYFRHTSYQMMRSFMILACINRYIASHSQHRFQCFNQYQSTIRCIVIVVILWLCICLFIPISLSINNGSCRMTDDLYALIYSIYLLIFAGILPIFILTTSVLSLAHNLQKMRNRVQTSINGLTRKRDRDYIRMFFYTTCSSSTRIELYRYFNNSLQFCIYIIISKSFRRKEFKDLLMKWSLFIKTLKEKL